MPWLAVVHSTVIDHIGTIGRKDKDSYSSSIKGHILTGRYPFGVMYESGNRWVLRSESLFNKIDPDACLVGVAQDGAILEAGTHSDLISKAGGAYAALVKNQQGK